MGVGLPYAMGIKKAFPEKDVFTITGEGSIQMNIQELSTAKQFRLPIKIINLNNRYLGMVRQWQEMFHGNRYAESYVDALPDFVKLAEAYGHVGIRVEDKLELRPAMERAFAMLVMGRKLTADDAHAAGFVNVVVAPGHTEAEARKAAREICALPAEAVASLRVDGAAVDPKHFTAIGDGRLLGASLPLRPGRHELAAEAPFGTLVYGFGDTDGYGLPGAPSAGAADADPERTGR